MFIKLCRLGKTPDIKYTPSGDAVVNLDLAYNVGYGEKAQTQWIIAAFFGERATKIHPYLEKGKLLLLTATDLQTELWSGNDGKQGCTLKCRVMSLEFAGGKDDSQGANQNGGQQPQPAQPAPQKQRAVPPQRHNQAQAGGFDNFDDDIAF